jgi:hypothetical protein
MKKLVRESMFDEVPNEGVPCRGINCESINTEMRYDNYGIPTGYYCDDCYENNYPYRKDAYFDPDYAGERLEDDY